MFAVLTCIVQGHDLRLVAVAAVICAVACASGFGFHRRSQSTADAGRWAWAGLTGLVVGCGVWATHFTAMLAYQPSLAIQYEVWTTAASLAMAVVGTGVGFTIPLREPSARGDLIGGAFTGLSIGAMHYTGIAAVRAQAHIAWDLPYVAASLALGVAGGMAAFSAQRRLSGWKGAIAAPALLVLGIVGLHFTAMTAVILRPDPALVIPGEVIGRGVLAAATVGLASLILAAGVSLIWMERLGRRSTFSTLRDALDVVPAGLAFYDPASRLIAWNEAFAALLSGFGVTAAAGMDRRTFMLAAHRAGWLVADPEGSDRPPSRAAASRAGSSQMHLPDGRWLRHESFLTADGGSVTVLNDVTEQKEAAAKLAAARDSAEAANRAKSEFLANMSHEIRTPLNGVLGVADLLGRTRLNNRQRELVGVIRQSGSLLNGLLADLLDLARVEAGVTELRPERVDIAELAEGVRNLFAGSADAKGLVLTAHVGPGAEGEVLCDPLRLRQVLGNLVSNAVKFTDAGQVALSVTRDGERLVFEVADTGPGFAEDLKATLFQRFRQGDATSTRRHGGTGLGLAICDEYVRLMGSELTCASTPGQGASFGFTLEAPALAPRRQRVQAAPPPPAAPGDFRVLVVDDNAVNRQLLRLVLESAGIDHACAEDGAEAVEAMMGGDFDAVLMDIQMPVMDGLEATRRIRTWERETARPRAPIYIVSANCLKEHVEAGRAAGADGHLNKPVSVAELLQTLQPHVAAGRIAA
jgi:signal transduction histidine kinase/ActR/RegA family two-component response regulator